MRVQIIVLNYNGIEILPLCLPSIVEASKHAASPTVVTVLDNQSTDPSLEWVKSHFPEVKTVVTPENRFLVSFNGYLRKIDDDIVILLNNDLRVEPGFVDPLVEVFKKYPDTFLASPQSFSFDGSQYEGGRTRARIRWGLLWSSAVFPGYERLTDQPGHTFASGFGAFHRKRFLALGGYDDLYLPGIIEDADLGFRAWREGYRSFYVPESHVYHMGQASFKKAFGKKEILILAHRNTFLFMWKNISDPTVLLEHFFFLVPRLIYTLTKGRTEFMIGFCRALPQFRKAWKRRRFPLKRARGDREVFSLANGFPIHRSYIFKKRWKRMVVSLFDAVGAALLWIFSRSRNPLLLNPKRILVVRIDSLGDGVLTLPAVEALKRRFPRAQIDFLANPSIRELYACFFPSATFHLFENNWLAMVGKLRPLHYDLGVDFRGDVRTLILLALEKIPHRWGRDGTGGRFLLTHRLTNPYEKHEILENLELVSGESSSAVASSEGMKQSDVMCHPEAAKRLKDLRSFAEPALSPLAPLRMTDEGLRMTSGKKIVIHIGAGYPSKRWTTSKFIEVAKRIQARGLGTPVFIGSANERALLDPYRRELGKDFLDLTGKTPLSELLTLLEGADLYIGNDSGPAHLAALLDRKIVLIFSGTNDFKRWAPWSSRLQLVHRPVPCSPCEERICPLSRQICLEDISVEEVFGAVEKALSD